MNREQFEFDLRGVWQRVVPFAVPACLAFGQAALAGSGGAIWLLAAAGALTAVIIGGTVLTPWPRLPSWAFVWPPLTYCLVPVLLHQTTGGAATVTGLLLLLPVFWVALHGSRGHLATVLAGCALALIAPPLLVGPPTYPSVEWAHIAVWLIIAPILGGTVQRLVRQTVAAKRRFLSLVQNAADSIIVIGSDRRINYASPSVAPVLGAAAHGMATSDLARRLHPDDARGVLEALEASLTDPGTAPVELQTRLRHADGRWHHFEIVATNLLRHPDVEGYVLNARDITERAVLEARLRQLAFHDPLTGLANRSLFGDRVAHAVAKSRRSESRMAVLYFDLDDFKTVNDSLGHQAGDDLLVMVARKLRNCLRGADTAARLGGDEFGVLLEDLDGVNGAVDVAGRLLAEFNAPLRVGDRDVMVGVSIGIVVPPAGAAVSAGDLQRDADAAMYAAKRRGKGRWELYDPGMHADALHRLELTTEIDRALAHQELHLAYQPVVELGTGRTVGVEALVRWHHPTRGEVLPVEFIPFAEDTGQIIAIGRWVLEEACRQGKRWHTFGDPLSIAVNLSPRQLQDPELVDFVRSTLAATGLPPSSLLLELTETALMSEPDAGFEVIRRLKRLGIRLAIDDFGTGYSSLAYLHRLPVDVIKVDRSFIADLGLGSDRSTLARGVLELVRSLQVSTVAEGVETSGQLAALRDLRCQLGQGFIFSQPVAAGEITDLLAAQGPFLAEAG